MSDMLSYRGYDAIAMTQYSRFGSDTLGSDFWVVTNPFIYYVGEKHSETEVKIPRGYLTDGASVPRVFWNVIPPWGKYGQAAILHDYLCEYLTVEESGICKSITRKECDQIFLEAMLVMGVPKAKAMMIHSAVSLYRITARVSKPSFDPNKYMVEQAIRQRYEQHGVFESLPKVQ